jgi:anti-sigma-K factor RskA
MMNEKCQPFRDLIPAYALAALDPHEIRLLEAHLTACPDCRAELEDYRAIGDGLLLAVPPQSPPPRVRARLIARLASTRASKVRPSWRAWPIWQLAGGLALAVLLVLNVSTITQLQTLQSQQMTLVEQLRTSQSALALVAYHEGRTLDLTGKQGTGTLILNSELNTGALFAWGLVPLDSAHTYQIWLIQPDGHRVSGGLFRPEPGQPFVSAIVSPLLPFSAFTGLGITVEPRGGSPAPTSPRVLGAEF